MSRSESRREQIVAQARRAGQSRERGYRERALKLFPHICAHCGRSFEGARLKELTVHHKDHNHDHNPPDGSNWELLCIYCHDDAHERMKTADAYTEGGRDDRPSPNGGHRPFADLDQLLKNRE